MNKIHFYLVQLERETTQEEFGKLLSAVSSIRGIGVNNINDNEASIFYENAGFSSKLTFIDKSQKKIVIECEKADPITLDMLRDLSKQFDFRVFSPDIGYFLPQDLRIIGCLVGFNENHEKALKILLRFGFKPIFVLRGTYNYYAEKQEDKSVHVINDNLLYYLIRLETEPEYTEEFNYKVADNIRDFVDKFDVDLIPENFYQYFRKSFKIINYSGFDIENPGRKVFVKPYILELNNLKQGFFKIAWDQSSLLHMDKIRSGETLHKTILRILNDDLKIANDYIGATVARVVEFDLDKENKLTPRLVIRVFIKEANMTEELKNKKERTWVSYKDISEESI